MRTKLKVVIMALDDEGVEHRKTFKVAPKTLHKVFMNAWVTKVMSGAAGISDAKEIKFTHQGKELDPEESAATEGWTTDVEIWAEPR